MEYQSYDLHKNTTLKFKQLIKPKDDEINTIIMLITW